MRDVLLVARFEVLRAIRTWRAVALLVLYGIAAGGAGWLFVRFVGFMENNVADQLGVARTHVPGSMLQSLVHSSLWREVLKNLTGSSDLVDSLIEVPPLAIFGLWFGFLVVPFFAASASAECVAIDVQSRAIRYEAQRTGRLELVLGRFAGQLALTAGAVGLASLVLWVVAMGFMAGNEPVGLAVALLAYAPRTWLFGVPFVALGTSASQITSSPAWARVLALGGTAGSWVAYGLARSADHAPWTWLADAVTPLLPQGWIRGLWEPGIGWAPAAIACAGLGLAGLAVGFARFSRRDL
jgi:ABC-type transport system involved in multi-copper enzyme maturation permease subunit